MTAYNHNGNLDRAFDVLWRNPAGVTANFVAEKLKWSKPYASYSLGRLYFYGTIDRVPHPTERGFRYQVKQREAASA